jgi:hypothetical protein
LFDGVADPADRPAHGEERLCTAGRQLERPRQGHETEIYGGTLAYETERFFGDLGGERDGGAPVTGSAC